jgi:hypothetical protein
MRIGARLTRAEFAFLSELGTTSRTRDSEYLFWAEDFLHGQERIAQLAVCWTRRKRRDPRSATKAAKAGWKKAKP